jgi:hypothetical protein
MRVFFASALLFASATLANAQAYTNWAQIAEISGGWTLDTMAVFHASNFVNVGCDVTGGGYATEPNDPGHDLFHTLIMAAFLNKKEVRFRLEGCALGKPRITEVSLR